MMPETNGRNDTNNNNNNNNNDHDTVTVASSVATTLKLLNIRDDVQLSDITADPGSGQPTPLAVQFEVINVDHNLVERHPKIALHVVELRVALAMCFLEFREVNDRL